MMLCPRGPREWLTELISGPDLHDWHIHRVMSVTIIGTASLDGCKDNNISSLEDDYWEYLR